MTDVRPDARLVQHQPAVLGDDLLVVHNEYAQGAGVDGILLRRARAKAVAQRDHHGKLRARAFLGLHADRAVHHLHDALRDCHAQARAAVLVLAGAVLLGKGVENFGDVGLVHADAGVPDAEAERGLILILRCTLHGQPDAAPGAGELDGVREDVDEDLLELHIVADIIVVHRAEKAAFIVQSLVLALAHDHGVDLLQHAGEGEFLPAQDDTPGLDAAHIQDVIDERQQMAGAVAGLFQITPCLLRKTFVVQGELVQT